MASKKIIYIGTTPVSQKVQKLLTEKNIPTVHITGLTQDGEANKELSEAFKKMIEASGVPKPLTQQKEGGEG